MIQTSIVKITGVIAALLFIAAGLAFHHSRRLMTEHRWIVLQEPITFEKGFSLSHAFTMDLAANYWIEVECRKTIPFETLEKTLDKELAAEFIVTDALGPVASGESSRWNAAGFTDYSISRRLGGFEGAPNHSYTLSLHISASLPGLASTHPVVKIVIDTLPYKHAYLTSTLFAILGIVLSVIASVCLLSILIQTWFRYRIAKRAKHH